MQDRGSRIHRPFRGSAFADAPADKSSRIIFSARPVILTLLLAAVVSAAGCGKKGAPLPPLVRIPEAVALVSTRRTGHDAYLTFRLPARNIDGSTPVTFSAVEVVALTADRPPSRAVFLERGTPVATIAMAAPSPASSPSAPSAPAPSPPGPAGAASAGASPGDEVTVRETLTDTMFVAVPLPSPPPPAGDVPPPDAANAPALRRYYMAFTRDARKRPGPSGAIMSISLSALPDPPGDLQITFSEQTITVTWSTVAEVSGYNIYADAPDGSSSPTPGVTPPRPLNAAVLDKATYAEPVRFGERACYRVRAVRGSAAERSEGPPSASKCEQPIDMFPPAAPDVIRLVPGSGEIAVEWSPSVAPDLAGYLVLRGTAGDDTLQPITTAPIRELRFVDQKVTPGVRYVYAVVAVDSAANRSAASATDQATAR